MASFTRRHLHLNYLLVFYISLFKNDFITIFLLRSRSTSVAVQMILSLFFLLRSRSTSVAEHIAECRKPKFYVPASAPSAEQLEHAEHRKSA